MPEYVSVDPGTNVRFVRLVYVTDPTRTQEPAPKSTIHTYRKFSDGLEVWRTLVSTASCGFQDGTLGGEALKCAVVILYSDHQIFVARLAQAEAEALVGLFEGTFIFEGSLNLPSQFPRHTGSQVGNALVVVCDSGALAEGSEK